MKTRIITNGSKYRPQERVLFWWENLHVIRRYGSFFDTEVAEYDSQEEAEQAIANFAAQREKRNAERKWRVI